MDLSKYDAIGDGASPEMTERYHALRTQLTLLCSATHKDIKAIDRILVELDEVQAGARDSSKRAGDPQRF